MFNVFGWVRARIRTAILEGVADAVEALESGTDPSPDLALPESLSRRLLPALPAGETGEEPSNGKSKKARGA